MMQIAMEMFIPSFVVMVVMFVATVSAADIFSDALLGLKSEMIDSSNSLYNWVSQPEQNTSGNIISACSWSGITCTKNSNMIIGLDISNKNLFGTISGKHIMLLKDLVNLNLSQNSFSGSFPGEVFSLVNLTSLDISRNNFSSQFPIGISAVQKLVVLDAFSNSFSGSLPEDIAKLENLKVLNLAGSYFEGPIPAAYGSLRSLEFLHLAGNSLDGAIPSELGMLQRLSHMEIGYNNYQGHIPWQLGNMSELQYLDIAGANLSGLLPDHFCNLNKLESLFLFRNQLNGSIPWCFGNISTLISLDLSDNYISGFIPESFANLTNIRLLSLMYNDLTGSVPQGIADLPFLDTLLIWNNYFSGQLPRNLGKNSKLKHLDVSTNSFTGSIPTDICAGGMLSKLILFSNNFTGGLSPALANCSSLIRLRLEDNSFSGEISLKFSLLQDIAYVDLSQNRFSEGIPVDIPQASKLQYFNISYNPSLGGNIPRKLWSLPQLENFSASSCGISGNLPPLSFCRFVTAIELNMNNITGTVPKSVSNCKALQRMSLANNQLTGDIPIEFASIPSLRILDLSYNEFKGELPVEFQNSSSLVLLNVSFNDLSGNIPSDKKFRLMGATAFVGNSKLCGEPLQSCSDLKGNQNIATLKSGRKSSKKPTWVVVLCGGMALFILISVIGIFYLQRERIGRWKMVPYPGLPQLKPDDILKSFSNTSTVETPLSSSTSVCKAVLPTGITISVKKIEWDVKRRTRMEELITQIGNARHKNLIRLLGLCCNNHVAYLLYDYLPNGNLEEKMKRRGDTTLSTWAAKYKVVIGVARGLCYLHHDCYPAIPHGDLKTSNIVFDDNMEPHLAEFGLRTLIQMNGDLVPGKISRTGSVSGTDEIDAIMEEELSKDICSFGEILMEILTNGRITNPGKSMQRKPRETILNEIYDENKVSSSGSDKEEIKLVLEVALLCTRCRPSGRPSMNDALKLLSGLKPQKHN
ncbi:hypothetical protein AQUCO_01600135v1 [Aquilegia coerulea]|uniref:Protein kinase domain-containing protein n=1 Tax=Aquilegia coerulea TaxID=218851 RepID=A0A2G5DQ95_AQUCA|nr:hypothetical protein AQUCO_01600135v1 [Aquilegia coerulea]